MIQVENKSRLRVITVDDSKIVSQRLGSLLDDVSAVELMGSAGTISEALAIIDAQRPHVVILDIHLASDKPRNGIDLLNLIKKAYPPIKVVMLTNLTDQRYKSLCLDAGAEFFLDKSNDFDRIPDVIDVLHDEAWIEESEAWWKEQK